MEEQLSALAAQPGSVDLFLDLPVGVHPGGFDTWRWPELFVHDMSAGAPPDAFFSLGQNWDSPPLHPQQNRLVGHRYFAACLRHHMRHAGYLRIDHVMSLHRLYWVPDGVSAADGVYVTYPAEELYAVLSVESHRNRCQVVGEDLGTVPPEVRPAMRRHGVARTYVAQAALRPRAADPLGPVPSGSVASINTHDMFPLAGFIAGDDIRARLATGQLDEAGARREAAARERLVRRLREWAERQAEDVEGHMPGDADGPRPVSDERPSHLGKWNAETQDDWGDQVWSVFRATCLRLRRTRQGSRWSEDLSLETLPQNMPGTLLNDPTGGGRSKSSRTLEM